MSGLAVAVWSMRYSSIIMVNFVWAPGFSSSTRVRYFCGRVTSINESEARKSAFPFLIGLNFPKNTELSTTTLQDSV